MITFNSIYPTKNQYDVGVNEDIVISLSADFELDPRNVKFMIHGVEIIPQIYSVYHGDNTSDLNVTLHTKQRIKYVSDRRYGQENSRYGMRDVYPSMLNYGSRYVVQVVVFGTNMQGEYEEVTETFAFTTEEGVFENQNPPEYFYSPMTQAMANYYPEWSKTRYDKFSNAQQLLNPLGEYLEKTVDYLAKQKLNTFMQTTNTNELSILQRVELGRDYPIKTLIAESGDAYYVQPEIKAISGITEFDLFASSDNSFQSFFYGKLPTRLNNEREILQTPVIFEDMEVGSLSQDIGFKIKNSKQVYVEVKSQQSSIYREGNNIRLLKIRISGVDYYDEDTQEDIIMVSGRPIPTRTQWKEISSIELIDAKEETIVVSMYQIPPCCSIVRDEKREITVGDNIEAVLWGAEDRNNSTVLQKRVEDGNTIFEIMANGGRTNEIQEFHLVDTDNSSPLLVKDFAVDEFTNLIYGIDDEYLYIFDKREQYTHLCKKLAGDNGSSDILIELEVDEMGLDDSGQKEVLFKTIHKMIGKEVVKYRIMITKPDGSVIYMKDDNTVTTIKNDATIFADQSEVVIPPKQYSVILEELGDYLFEVEVLYRGGQVTRDQKIYRILTKPALKKFKLERILDGAMPLSIHKYEDQKIKIYDSKNVLNTLILHKDGVMINYDDKILYFIEDYDSVEVDS